MKIKKLARQKYELNTLAEVIAQIRFSTNMQIQQGLPIEFSDSISEEFPVFELQKRNKISLSGQKLIQDNETPVFSFSSLDKNNKVTLTSEDLTVSCTNYDDWTNFYSNLKNAFQKLKQFYKIPIIKRVGLRYINLIQKEKLNLVNTSWSELISPQIIGHLSHSEMFEDISDEDSINGMNSVTQVKLEDCSLTFQSGIVLVNGKKAFLLDTDLYDEKEKLTQDLNLKKEFEVLHDKSGSIFQHCITEKLTQSLKPI